MDIYLIRHGQAASRGSTAMDQDAVDAVFNQTVDPPLSERGWREAEQVARWFEAHPVDHVYASPRRRAAETAEPTCEALGLEPTTVEGVTELRTGRLPAGSVAKRVLRGLRGTPLLSEGLRRKVASVVQVPLYYGAWRAGHTEGGEPQRDFEARLDAALWQIAKAHPSGRVAVFAHGYVIFYTSAIRSRWSPSRLDAMRRPYVPNGSITHLSVEAGRAPLVRSYARTSHLR